MGWIRESQCVSMDPFLPSPHPTYFSNIHSGMNNSHLGVTKWKHQDENGVRVNMQIWDGYEWPTSQSRQLWNVEWSTLR